MQICIMTNFMRRFGDLNDGDGEVPLFVEI